MVPGHWVNHLFSVARGLRMLTTSTAPLQILIADGLNPMAPAMPTKLSQATHRASPLESTTSIVHLRLSAAHGVRQTMIAPHRAHTANAHREKWRSATSHAPPLAIQIRRGSCRMMNAMIRGAAADRTSSGGAVFALQHPLLSVALYQSRQLFCNHCLYPGGRMTHCYFY